MQNSLYDLLTIEKESHIIYHTNYFAYRKGSYDKK